MIAPPFEPRQIPDDAQRQMRQVLASMSTGSIQTFLREIQAGHVDGGRYGDNYHTRSTRLFHDGDPMFRGCFLGWAGFLENRSVLELAETIGWFSASLGGTALEGFVSRIDPGHTPENDPDSLALYLFVSDYLTKREEQNAPGHN
jgi:hypothetical protein